MHPGYFNRYDQFVQIYKKVLHSVKQLRDEKWDSDSLLIEGKKGVILVSTNG